MRIFDKVIWAGALIGVVSFAGVADTAGANAAIVVPVGQRLEAIKAAERTFQPTEVAWKSLVADLPDPFFRAPASDPTEVTGEKDAVEQPRAQKSSEQVLNGVAPRITPTGTMLIGSEPYLLIGGRRYRVGDQISVTFEEMVYAVEIASIERNSYTLRLNETELRRDFK